MLECLPADSGVRVAEAPEPVVVVLEQVRVDRTDPEALGFGERPQLVPVVHPVPWDVEGDARTRSGQAVDERGVGDALVDRACRAGPREDMEAGARVPVAPRGRLDLEPAELLAHVGLVSHAGESDSKARGLHP